MKTICPIHRFSYSGNSCPFCEKERIDYLAHRFVHEVKKEIKTDRQINESDLKKLTEKFNRR